MNHIKAIGIKFIFTAIVVYSIFGIFYNASLGRLFWMSLLVTGISYIIGDLFILKRTGNLLAVIADFGLAFLTMWILGLMIIDVSMPTVIAALFASFFIAISESLFHIYMKEQVFNRKEHSTVSRRQQLQTEFSEETNEHTLKKDRKK